MPSLAHPGNRPDSATTRRPPPIEPSSCSFRQKAPIPGHSSDPRSTSCKGLQILEAASQTSDGYRKCSIAKENESLDVIAESEYPVCRDEVIGWCPGEFE